MGDSGLLQECAHIAVLLPEGCIDREQVAGADSTDGCLDTMNDLALDD